MEDWDSSGDGDLRLDDNKEGDVDDSDGDDAVSIGGGGRRAKLLPVRWCRAAPGAKAPLLGRPDIRSWPSSPSVVGGCGTF